VSESEALPGRRPFAAGMLWLVALLVLVPLALHFAGSGYAFRVATTVGVFAILAVSLNLITGTTGLLSLGHAAFYGIGAYAAALTATVWDWPFYVTLPFAGIVTALAGILLALPTMRLVSIYFAVATLGLGEIIHVTLLNWVGLTRGPMGIAAIPGIAIPGLFGVSNVTTYLVVAGALAVATFAIHRFTYSYYGNALRALREDDQCAEAMGLDIVRLKIEVFGIACFFAGVAGALWAHTTGYISPNDFRFGESIQILAMIVVGGLGSVPGAILGATILIVLPEVLRPIGDYRMIVVGAVMFASILFLPRGLLGEMPTLAFVRRQFSGALPSMARLGLR